MRYICKYFNQQIRLWSFNIHFYFIFVQNYFKKIARFFLNIFYNNDERHSVSKKSRVIKLVRNGLMDRKYFDAVLKIFWVYFLSPGAAQKIMKKKLKLKTN